MAILTPSAAAAGETERQEAEGERREEDKQISLGVMTGRLSQGSAYLAGFREDRRNQAKPGEAGDERLITAARDVGGS